MTRETSYKNKENGQVVKFVQAVNPITNFRSGKSKRFEMAKAAIKEDSKNWEEE